MLGRAGARLGAGEIDAACADGSAALHLIRQAQRMQNFARIASLAAAAAASGATAVRVAATWHPTRPC